jgi:hypothetical protein
MDTIGAFLFFTPLIVALWVLVGSGVYLAWKGLKDV